MNKSQEMNRYAWKQVWLFFAFVASVVAICLICGCATPPTLIYDSQGNLTGGTTSWGFLRTIKIHQKKADGSEISIETNSNTGEVLNGMNQVLGTMVDGAGKLMP